MSYKLITPPAVEPIGLPLAKSYLRVDQDLADDDALINLLISSARETCENRTHRKFITQTVEKYLDDWPLRIYQPKVFIDPSLGLGGSGYGYPVTTWPQPQDYIELMPGVQSVLWVKYYPQDGAERTFDPSNYQADTVSDNLCRVMLNPNSSWPSDPLRSANGICVRFTCGYGDTADTVPKCVQLAMLYLITMGYEIRQPVNIERGVPSKIQETVDDLLAPEVAPVF